MSDNLPVLPGPDGLVPLEHTHAHLAESITSTSWRQPPGWRYGQLMALRGFVVAARENEVGDPRNLLLFGEGYTEVSDRHAAIICTRGYGWKLATPATLFARSRMTHLLACAVDRVLFYVKLPSEPGRVRIEPQEDL